MMTHRVRRLVTGDDGAGRAVVVEDETLDGVPQREGPVAVLSRDLWINPGTPADLGAREDPTGGPFSLHPPAGGAVFRIVWFMPESTWRPEVDAADGERLLSDIGAIDPGGASAARHPMMHRSDTIDYAVVMSGACTLVLDDSEVEVRAGDTVVQIGNNHAWSNRTCEPCQIAFIQIDGRR